MSTPTPTGAAPSPAVIASGDIVRTTREDGGMEAGSLGLFLGWCLSSGAAVVTFDNRGPKPIASDAPIRVRGIERVALHADLVMLARLSQALARARAVPLAA
jgi:hypothetical protein